MDEAYKRDLVRQWAALCATPYVDTINRPPPANLAEPWFTIVFDTESTELETYAGATLERGLVDVVFAGAPGTGDSSLLQAAAADVDTLLAQSDPNGRLVLELAQAPAESTNGTADHSYRVMIGINYTYRNP